MLDRATLSVVKRIPLGVRPRAVAVNPVTNRVYALSGTTVAAPGFGRVTVVDGVSLGVVASVELPTTQATADLAVNPCTSRVYLSNTSQGLLHVIDGQSHAVLQNIAIGPGPVGLAVDESTDTVYAAQSRRAPGQPDVRALGAVVDDGVNPPIVRPRPPRSLVA